MKKNILIIAMLFSAQLYGQNYDHILNYAFNGTPVNGVKIKTNLPFTTSSQMPTINISGYNYGGSEPINLTVTYYIYHDSGDPGNVSKFYFYNPGITSYGSYTPVVQLANEGGKVIIYINDRVYFQRFTISAYAYGMGEPDTWFQGWTAADESIKGTGVVEVPYRNRFKGDIFLSGNGIWNASGNVGIGTIAPDSDAKLDVKGNIFSSGKIAIGTMDMAQIGTNSLAVNGDAIFNKAKVKLYGNWPDYVFQKEFKLPSLKEIESYIKIHQHLPEVPSASEVEKNGIDLGDNQVMLLKKIEELTLFAIGQNKKMEEQSKKIEELEMNFKKLQAEIKN